MRPVIGLAPDLDPPLPDPPAEREYLEALTRAGAEPVLLEGVTGARDADVRALLIRGGPFDIPPQWYGHTPQARIDPPHPRRLALERDLLLHADRAGLPVLGVCNGAQLMAVLRGGTLVQDLPTLWPAALDHERGDRRDRAVHGVDLVAGSRLASLLAATHLEVNSSHHQAIDRPGRRVRVVGRAPDGVVEAIEDPDHPFWVGVQWHPERLEDAVSARLFEAFVEAAGAHLPSR